MKTTSLSRWLQQFWIFTILAGTGMLLLLQMYLTARDRRSTLEGIRSRAAEVQAYTDRSVRMVDDIIFEMFAGTGNVNARRIFGNLCEEPGTQAYVESSMELMGTLSRISSWSEMCESVVFAMPGRGGEWICLETGATDLYKARQEIKTAVLRRLLEEGKLPAEFYGEGESGFFMVRCIRIEQAYFCINISKTALLDSFSGALVDRQGCVLIADEKGNVLAASPEWDAAIDPASDGKFIRRGGERYLQAGTQMADGRYYLAAMTPARAVQAGTRTLLAAFGLMYAVLSALLVLLGRRLRRMIAAPLTDMTFAMKEIEEGQLDTSVPEISSITEFRQMTRSFNHMVRRIADLKMENYEKELAAQKASMQYLQLQIKPHFYANAINIIYSLAQTGDYETIQKISSAIVNYSRYMFRDATELVELEKEIEHVRYYMQIQEIRYHAQILCEVDVPEKLTGVLVPPFCVQSFVENSVKYAFNTRKSCEIRITARLEKGDTLVLRISDNGPGYDPAILQGDWERKDEKGHIGLTNVRTRLQLIYGERAEIRLSNEGGAVAEIRIPFIDMGCLSLDLLSEEE